MKSWLYLHITILNGVKMGDVYNGADDDGSGTVALLEIARSIPKAKKRRSWSKRSIMFLHVTGEEHGLLGSNCYSTVLIPLWRIPLPILILI
jgi:Zn-dependent M28 family amino/carboxypeptidase